MAAKAGDISGKGKIRHVGLMRRSSDEEVDEENLNPTELEALDALDLASLEDWQDHRRPGELRRLSI